MRFGTTTVTRMTPRYDEPGYAKKHYRALAKTYSSQKKKFRYSNFDGHGSVRVVVHQGYGLDVWDYYTRSAVSAHKADVRLNQSILIGALGICLVDAILSD
jgi:hypothetical protein